MKKDLLGTLGYIIGFLIYIILSCVDRFIVPIPDIIYIILMVGGDDKLILKIIKIFFFDSKTTIFIHSNN